jgi:hypothetical protein
VTAQPSPDLPDSLRRDRKAAGEDVHQAAAEAYQAALSPPVDGAPVALTAADMRLRRLGAAVDEAVRLTEQRVRAECAAEIQRLAAQLAEANATTDAYHADRDRQRTRAERAEADLAAMTARAEQVQPVLIAARSWLTQETGSRDISPADARLIAALRSYDETDPLWALSLTETGVQATVEGQDANGPQDDLGGAA